MIETNELKTLKISNGALQSPQLPRRLKIFAWGDNDSTDGVYRAGEKTAAQLAANQKRYGYERVAIDFDHCTVPGTDTHKELLRNGQPPLIFGYGRVHAAPGDGIYLEEITWTPLGAQHAKNFEDISPALREEGREVTLIHSVALTPNGKVNGLQFFSAVQQPKNQQTTNMNEENVVLISDLAPVIGLSASAGKADVLARFGQLAGLCGPVRVRKIDEGGHPGAATLSATIDGEVVTFSGEEVARLMRRFDALEKRLTDGEAAATDSERVRLVKLFSAEGKAPKRADGQSYSAEELATLDVGTLKLLHANTPVTVPFSARHQTGQVDGKRFRDAKGNVNLASVFNEENARRGQTHPEVATA